MFEFITQLYMRETTLHETEERIREQDRAFLKKSLIGLQAEVERMRQVSSERWFQFNDRSDESPYDDKEYLSLVLDDRIANYEYVMKYQKKFCCADAQMFKEYFILFKEFEEQVARFDPDYPANL